MIVKTVYDKVLVHPAFIKQMSKNIQMYYNLHWLRFWSMSPMDTLLSHEAMGEDSSMLGSIDTADVIGHMTLLPWCVKIPVFMGYILFLFIYLLNE